MDESTRARIERALGRRIVHAARIVGGGFSPAERWRLTLADGDALFAKVGVTPATAGWVRAEHRRYTALGPRTWLARCHGLADDPDRPALLLEDLSHGHWPPPWEPADVARV